jgi:hypothetical protein
MIGRRTLILFAMMACPVASFVVASSPSFWTTLKSTASTETDDLIKPAYEIEPITLRVGHGFDIHRMAPIDEAGQPVVIGGVEITHKDQKVSQSQKKSVFSETNSILDIC